MSGIQAPQRLPTLLPKPTVKQEEPPNLEDNPPVIIDNLDGTKTYIVQAPANDNVRLYFHRVMLVNLDQLHIGKLLCLKLPVFFYPTCKAFFV